MDSILVWVHKMRKDEKKKNCHLKLGTLYDSFLISHSLGLWLKQNVDSDEVASGSPLPGVKVITLY